jgi:hypothetical protein
MMEVSDSEGATTKEEEGDEPEVCKEHPLRPRTQNWAILASFRGRYAGDFASLRSHTISLDAPKMICIPHHQMASC